MGFHHICLVVFLVIAYGSISEACSEDSIMNCIVKNDVNNNMDWPCVKLDAATACIKAMYDGCDDVGKEYAQEQLNGIKQLRGECPGLAEGDCLTNRISSCAGQTPYFQGAMDTQKSLNMTDCSMFDAPKVKECLTEHLKACPNHEAIKAMIWVNDFWQNFCNGDFTTPQP